MARFLIRVLVAAAGLWLASKIVPGIQVHSWESLAAAAHLIHGSSSLNPRRGEDGNVKGTVKKLGGDAAALAMALSITAWRVTSQSRTA